MLTKLSTLLCLLYIIIPTFRALEIPEANSDIAPANNTIEWTITAGDPTGPLKAGAGPYNFEIENLRPPYFRKSKTTWFLIDDLYETILADVSLLKTATSPTCNPTQQISPTQFMSVVDVGGEIQKEDSSSFCHRRAVLT